MSFIDEILDNSGLDYRTYHVEAWDRDVQIRALSVSEVTSMLKDGDIDGAHGTLSACRIACKLKDNTPLLTLGDVLRVMDSPTSNMKGFREIAKEVFKISGLVTEEEEEEKN